VVSLFVNPAQFGPNEDLAAYPRDEERDATLAEAEGADILFMPSVDEVYPPDHQTYVVMDGIATILEGSPDHRGPGHFRGVMTVVTKLLNIVQPDRAYFGEKDLQQLAVVRRMVRDLALPVSIVGVATVREEDGLALSSRNQYLDPSERRAAPVLYRALVRAREMAQSGERDAGLIQSSIREIIAQEPLVRLQYFELVDEDLQSVHTVSDGTYAACAAFFGTTRLIDNIRCL
jgi:pantoate--beta-alanine ligase